jgi:PAS domain S-box-containing protein
LNVSNVRLFVQPFRGQGGFLVSAKPTYEELQRRVEDLEQKFADRKRDTYMLKKYTQNLGFLSRTSTEFLEFQPDQNIYQLIGERLKELAGNCVIAINSYDKGTDTLCTRAVEGLGKYSKAVLKLIGRDPVGMSFSITNEYGRSQLATGKLVSGPRGLHELSFGKIPAGICHRIEDLLSLGDIYAIGIACKGELFGSAIIITRGRSSGLEGEDIVQTFMHQAAVALQRSEAEKALVKARDGLEKRVEERTADLAEANEQLRLEIEERKLAEEALRRSEERYTLATKAAGVGVWDWNLQTNEFHLDGNVKAILGYSDAEIPNNLEVWSGYIHPDDKQPVMEAFQNHIDGKTPEFAYEHRMLHKDGSIRWIMARGVAIRDAEGNPVRVVGTDTDITQRKQAEEALKAREKELQVKTINLEEANTALKVLLDKRDEDRKELEEKVKSNMKWMVLPYLEKLKRSSLNQTQEAYANILESLLSDVVSPFTQKLSTQHWNLTPTEIQVAHHIKDGKTTKEIAELLNSSMRAIEFHRENLRKKLGLKNTKINLRSHLLSLS